MVNTYAIIGAGFYGLYLASHLAKLGHKVVVIDESNQAMGRASYANQARVHNGYHYPRSILTALRSRQLFPEFVSEFSPSIASDFEKIYLIGSLLGNVNAAQFESFCRRIGADFEFAPQFLKENCNRQFVDGAFRVKEFAFNAVTLRDMMLERLSHHNVEFVLNTRVTKVRKVSSNIIVSSQEGDIATVNQVFNCTYSRLNELFEHGITDLIPLKHELTEICLVEVPKILKNTGVTVMCGPFFSFMPFPSTQYHSFTHVRYTPHATWKESEQRSDINKNFSPDNYSGRSAWLAMKRDASRFIPLINEMKLKKSIFEIKTILPSSETTDSRPILFRQDHGMVGFHSIMGGKIDNVYDVIEMVKKRGLDS
ncbi:unnamed protein product [Ectocarpus sp. 12 AP-2014]